MAAKKRGLGRGLEALLGPQSKQTTQSELTEIPIEWVRPGKYQPRKEFDEQGLAELAASIGVHGIIQPVVVRKIQEDHFELIAGERRWRAAQLAGLEKVPAVIRRADDEAVLAMSLIENIQREDLNPWEESQALHRLVEEFGLTHAQVAEAVGRSRTAVTNSLRLANLAPAVARMLIAGDLEMGHARTLLTLEDDSQERVAREIVAKQLNVRQAEALVRQLGRKASQPVRQPVKLDADTRHLQDQLSSKFGQPVQINHSSKGKGKLIIPYNSLDELDGILHHFGELE